MIQQPTAINNRSRQRERERDRETETEREGEGETMEDRERELDVYQIYTIPCQISVFWKQFSRIVILTGVSSVMVGTKSN